MTSPTPTPGEFPDDVDRLHQGIEDELKRAADAQPAEGSQAAGDDWGQSDPALRAFKPSCGAIYLTGSGIFVVCEGEWGHGGEVCRGDGFRWASSAALVRPGQPPRSPEPAPSAPEGEQPNVPGPRNDLTLEEVRARLRTNLEARYRIGAAMGPYRIDPNRIDPELLNDVDRTMLASLLRHAADRLDPETGPPAYVECDCEDGSQ